MAAEMEMGQIWRVACLPTLWPYNFLMRGVVILAALECRMPRWIVSCPDCKEEFTHSEIKAELHRDPFTSPPKPTLPQEGIKQECPKCHKTAVYRAFELRYRAN